MPLDKDVDDLDRHILEIMKKEAANSSPSGSAALSQAVAEAKKTPVLNTRSHYELETIEGGRIRIIRVIPGSAGDRIILQYFGKDSSEIRRTYGFS